MLTIMNHHNSQWELKYLLIQQAEKSSYMSDCMWIVDIQLPSYFQTKLAIICFILPLQISLTVLQNINHNDDS